MPLIQDPTVGRKLQRGLRLVNLPDAVLAPEIVGVVLLEDWTAPLSDIERGCIGAVTQVAVAGEFGIITLVRVGAPAQYDLVVTQAHFSVSGVSIVTVGIPTAGLVGLTTSANTSFTDQELPGRPTSQMALDTQVGVPSQRIVFNVRCLASTLYKVNLAQRIGTIGQGANLTSLMIACAGANIHLTAGFKWTESSPLG